MGIRPSGLSLAQLKKVQRRSPIQNCRPKMFPKVRKSCQIIEATKKHNFHIVAHYSYEMLPTFSLKMVSKLRKSRHIQKLNKFVSFFSSAPPPHYHYLFYPEMHLDGTYCRSQVKGHFRLTVCLIGQCSIVYGVQCTVHTLHCTYTVYSTQYRVDSTECRVQCTVHRAQCTVHSAQGTVHSAQCKA